jgi:hypothetical protein
MIILDMFGSNVPSIRETGGVKRSRENQENTSISNMHDPGFKSPSKENTLALSLLGENISIMKLEGDHQATL